MTEYADGARIVEFYQQVTDRLQQLPGVTAAGGVRLLPLARTIGDWSITIDGREIGPGDNPNGDFQFATPGYSNAMGLTLVRGRWLTGAVGRTLRSSSSSTTRWRRATGLVKMPLVNAFAWVVPTARDR